MSKGQITGQVFVYIMAIIIVGAILLIGYSVFKGMTEDKCDVELVSFKTSLDSYIPKYKDFGVVQQQSIVAPCGAKEVCFVDSRNITEGAGELFIVDTVTNPIIRNSIQDGVEMNVFIVGESTTGIDWYPELHVADPGYLCVPNTGGNIILTFSGSGRATTLS